MKEVLGERHRARRCRAGRLLRPACDRRGEGTGRDDAPGDVRADPVRAALPRSRRGDRAQQCRAAGSVVVHLHERPARSRAIHVRRGIGLRDRQRQHRSVRRRDRRRVRRREGDGRRSRKRLGRWRAYMRRQTNTINYGIGPTARAGHPASTSPHKREASSRHQAGPALRNSSFQCPAAPGAIGGEIR